MVKEYARGRGLTYFAPHNNEVSALRAAQMVVGERGGRFLQLTHTGSRNISFVYKNVAYAFDPNRMFTEVGAKASLRQLGKTYSEEALRIVLGFAGDVLAEIDPEHMKDDLLVGLHNNTPGNYSIQSYLPGGRDQKEASSVYVNPQHSPDNFFFVTEYDLFVFLRGKGFNVAIQSPTCTDDGSLSVLCADAGIRYVNVEAEHGRFEEQVVMIKALLS